MVWNQIYLVEVLFMKGYGVLSLNQPGWIEKEKPILQNFSKRLLS